MTSSKRFKEDIMPTNKAERSTLRSGTGDLPVQNESWTTRKTNPTAFATNR